MDKKNPKEDSQEEYEIINGGGLDISPVYSHINNIRKKNDDDHPKKNIVIPNEKK